MALMTGWGEVDLYWSNLPGELARDMAAKFVEADLQPHQALEGHAYSPDIPMTISQYTVRVRVEGFPWMVMMVLEAIFKWERNGFEGPIFEKTVPGEPSSD